MISMAKNSVKALANLFEVKCAYIPNTKNYNTILKNINDDDVVPDAKNISTTEPNFQNVSQLIHHFNFMPLTSKVPYTEKHSNFYSTGNLQFQEQFTTTKDTISCDPGFNDCINRFFKLSLNTSESNCAPKRIRSSIEDAEQPQERKLTKSIVSDAKQLTESGEAHSDKQGSNDEDKISYAHASRKIAYSSRSINKGSTITKFKKKFSSNSNLEHISFKIAANTKIQTKLDKVDLFLQDTTKSILYKPSSMIYREISKCNPKILPINKIILSNDSKHYDQIRNKEKLSDKFNTNLVNNESQTQLSFFNWPVNYDIQFKPTVQNQAHNEAISNVLISAEENKSINLFLGDFTLTFGQENIMKSEDESDSLEYEVNANENLSDLKYSPVATPDLVIKNYYSVDNVG